MKRIDRLIGSPPPAVMLGEFDAGEVNAVAAREVLSGGKTLVVGVPGAFTPLCSGQHIPSLLANRAQLLERFDKLVCIVASDPFVTDAWARSLGAAGAIRFLSDGNLEFSKALGLVSHMPSYFLGHRSERYTLVVEHGLIVHGRVEGSILDFQCTRPESILAYV